MFISQKTLGKIFNKVFNLLPIYLKLFIKNHAETIEKMDYEKDDIYLYVDSEVEFSCRLKSCYHEPETIKWIEKFIGDNETVFDVGANVGAYSLVIAKYKRGKTKVYAFEPCFTTFAKLCRNILLNRCDNIIFPFQIALSNKYSVDYFNYSSLEAGSAYHAFGESKHFNFEKFVPVYKQPVISYSIDRFVKVFNIPSPQHIKIDVDSTEFDIVRGAKKTLSDKNFKSLNIEVNESLKESTKMRKYIESLGLVFYKKYTDLNADDPEPNLYKIYNYIFINPRPLKLSKRRKPCQ